MAVNYHEIRKEIIELSKTGNSKAQYQLYQLYAKAMFNVCYRIMNNREEAEDILQESFSEAFSKIDTYRYESSFGLWLKKIVVNKSINSLKKKKAELVFYEDLQAVDIVKEIDDENLELTVENVHKAIEKLPDGYRVIFSLYLLEGYDHKEISQIMEISESTSKTQYLRAKQKLREILNLVSKK